MELLEPLSVVGPLYLTCLEIEFLLSEGKRAVETTFGDSAFSLA